MVYIKSTSTNNYYQKFELFTKRILFINIFGVMRVVTLLNLFSQSPACLPVPPCRHKKYLYSHEPRYYQLLFIFMTKFIFQLYYELTKCQVKNC